MKIQKGEPGYVKARKIKFFIGAAAEFAIVIALVVLGYVKTGNRMNFFTVLAVVGCLPAAKMLVEFITMYPHRGIEEEKYEEIEEKAPLITKTYDLLITSTGKGMPVEAFVIYGHVLCGYTSSPKTDEAGLSKEIKKVLSDHRHDKMTVKIFHDYAMFLARAEGLNNIAAVERPEHDRKEQSIRKILCSISM